MCDQYPAYAFWRSKISLTVRSADASPPDHISSLQFMPGVFGRTHISSTFDARFHGLGFENWCRRCICATSVHLLPIPVLEPIGKYLGKCLGNDRDQSWPSGGGVRPLFSHTGHPIAVSPTRTCNYTLRSKDFYRAAGWSPEPHPAPVLSLSRTGSLLRRVDRTQEHQEHFHNRAPVPRKRACPAANQRTNHHSSQNASSIPQQLSTEATS